MTDFQITIEASPDAADTEILSNGLSEHSYSKNFPYDHAPLAIFVRNTDQQIVGGLFGATAWGWLHVSRLWIREELRGKGYGKQLLEMAEREALARGCHHAHLDTFSFQALDFYRKLGYEVFGELPNYPEGAKRYYLKKTLTAD